MTSMRHAAPLALLALAAGCSSDNYSNDRYFCSGFGPSNNITSTTDAGCTSCTVSNLAAAIDGTLDTYADVMITTAATGQGVTIRATATGATFPKAATPGALVGISTTAQSALNFTITTYLKGTMQETYPNQTAINVTGQDGAKPNAYYGINGGTTATFDAVEIKIASANGTGGQDVHVNGVCVNGGGLY